MAGMKERIIQRVECPVLRSGQAVPPLQILSKPPGIGSSSSVPIRMLGSKGGRDGLNIYWPRVCESRFGLTVWTKTVSYMTTEDGVEWGWVSGAQDGRALPACLSGTELSEEAWLSQALRKQ